MESHYDPRRDEALPEDAKELAVDLFYSPAASSGPQFGSLKDYTVLTELDQGRHGPILLARSAYFARGNLVVLKEVRLQRPTSPDPSKRSPPPSHSDAPATTTNHRPLDVPFDIIREFCLHDTLVDRTREQGVYPLAAAFGILADPKPEVGAVPGQGQIESISLVLAHYPLTLASLIDFYDESGEQFTFSSIKFLFLQILQGLAWLHSEGIVHRDLTPGNILIDFQGNLALADLGEARQYERPDSQPSPPPASLNANTETHVDHTDTSSTAATTNARMTMTRRRTTLWWRAPEVCLGATRYGPEADIWSAGCILAEMLLLEPILQGDTDLHMLDLTTKLLGPPREQDMHALEHLNADPIDLTAWTDSRRHAVQGEGSLELKFDGRAFGGSRTAEMLRTMLAWNPADRITAYEAIAAASMASRSSEKPGVASVAAGWWLASPRAEDALFQADTAVRRLKARWEAFASRYDSVKVPRRYG